MKRWSCALLLLALLTALTACGKQSETPAAPATGQAVSLEPAEQTAAPQTEATESAAQTTETAAATEPAPEAAPGYKLYKNELFITEIPEDWTVQTVKLQFTGSTISEPHGDDQPYSYIEVACSGVSEDSIRERYDGLLASNVSVRLYETEVAGQPATVLERGGPFGSARELFGAAPTGAGWKLSFNCPDGGEALNFARIQEPMDHFLSALRWKTGEEAVNSGTEPTETRETGAAARFFDAVEIEDFAEFEGMTRRDLMERCGAPSSDDGSIMIYKSVSWNGWIGDMRFSFDSAAEDGKPKQACWITSGDEGIFNELCDALNARGLPGGTAFPKEGQTEKTYVVNGFELTAGNEDSPEGKWTCLYAWLHD